MRITEKKEEVKKKSEGKKEAITGKDKVVGGNGGSQSQLK